MSSSAWDEERAAAEIVATHLGATEEPEKRDIPGAPPGTHDYDIRVGDRVVALEVTSATDGEVRSFWGTVHDQKWDEPILARSWGLTLKPGSRTRGLRERVAPFLRTLEEENVERFDETQPSRARSSNAVTEAIRKLDEIGVQAGISVDDQPSRIVISVVGTGGWGSQDTLIELVENAAQRKAEQLSRAAAEERHVFLWLDWSNHDAQAAMHFVMDLGVLPDSPAVLPEGVDKVWIMPFALADGRPRPLLCATTNGWEILRQASSGDAER